MTCEELLRYLSDYIDNNLDNTLMQAAREHLSTCQNCHIVWDSTKRTISLYREQQQAFVIPQLRQQTLYNEILHAFEQRKTD